MIQVEGQGMCGGSKGWRPSQSLEMVVGNNWNNADHGGEMLCLVRCSAG